MLLAQSREAPFELTGLTVAPGEIPQVRQQGDGLVVPRGHLGADKLPGLGPGGLRILGQFIQAPLPGCFALLFPQGLTGSRRGLGLPVALQAELRGRIQQIGHRPPGTDDPPLIRICPQAVQQLHLGPCRLVPPDQHEEPVLFLQEAEEPVGLADSVEVEVRDGVGRVVDWPLCALPLNSDVRPFRGGPVLGR
jgi:hypothetical protein